MQHDPQWSSHFKRILCFAFGPLRAMVLAEAVAGAAAGACFAQTGLGLVGLAFHGVFTTFSGCLHGVFMVFQQGVYNDSYCIMIYIYIHIRIYIYTVCIYILMYTALYFIILCGVIFHYQELMHYGSTIGQFPVRSQDAARDGTQDTRMVLHLQFAAHCSMVYTDSTLFTLAFEAHALAIPVPRRAIMYFFFQAIHCYSSNVKTMTL